MPDFAHEQKAGLGRDLFICGIDEVGRGPWAGPVVACAVMLRDEILPADLLAVIDDSKKISEKRRLVIAERLEGLSGLAIGYGMANAAEIDSLNILKASLLAMSRAVADLPHPPDHALVDGNRLPTLPCPATAIVGGDAKAVTIAAASILAKTRRDNIMRVLAGQYAGYGWERNMGYGTAEHQAAILRHGITPEHRRSFRPISESL